MPKTGQPQVSQKDTQAIIDTFKQLNPHAQAALIKVLQQAQTEHTKLTAEKADLQKRVSTFENTQNKQKDATAENTILRQENKSLIEENKSLRRENRELKKRIEKYEGPSKQLDSAKPVAAASKKDISPKTN